MSEERPDDRHGERGSQLSAMFDGELPAAECELLARRLARDESLRAQWSRYSLIGAALRAERGVVLHDRVAVRVQTVLAKEASYGDAATVDNSRAGALVPAAAGARRQRWSRVGAPLAGAGIAASVAAISIFWLRGSQEPGVDTLASTTSPTTVLVAPEPTGTTVAVNSSPARSASADETGLYSTPAPSSATSLAPPARLANYVVAHSEYSGPLTRRMALLGIVGAETGEGTVVPEAAPTDVESADAP